MHKEWEIRSLLSEETLEKAWRNLKEKIGSEMRVFERWKDRDIEREIERNEILITWGRIYRTLVNLDRWRCQEVSRIKPSTDTSVEVQKHQTQEIRLDWSTKCRGGVEIAIRKSLEARQIARCRGGVDEVSKRWWASYKISFSRREKQRHECNQACNSTNDPNTILTSQNHLLTAILSTWIPKTHTHTHTKQV